MDLQERLAYLEKVNRFRMQALEMIRDLSDFQNPVNRLEDPGVILNTCREQAAKLVQVKTVAFYLIDEASADFDLYRCWPEEGRTSLMRDVEQFVDDATFSRAVIEKKPVTAANDDFTRHYLFHVLSTVSRTRGMFVAVLDGRAREVPEAAFELLSILMTHCANALESYELYHRLRLSNRSLAESEARYRSLAETAREIIITATLDGQISYINPSGLKVSGYGPGEATSIHRMFKGLDQVLASLKTSPKGWHRVLLKNRAGDRIPVEISLVLVDHDRDEEHLLIVGRDISEQVRAEKDRAALEARLWQARKMESIGLLAGGTAHDFNNLLSVICNYTELARKRLDGGLPAVRHLEKVENAAKDAMALAKQLYTIGREDHHETGRVEIGGIIQNTLKLLGGSLGRRFTLSVDLDSDPLFIMAEETRIRQVLMNLITNAAHAMKEGIIIVGADRYPVEAGAAQQALGVAPGSYVRLWVRDGGPGIPQEVLPHIFDPYFTTKANQENAGLGLAVVHGIVRNYRGAVEVESGPGAGTCFYLYLPEAD